MTSVASKNSAICGKFEIRSRAPGIIAVRYAIIFIKAHLKTFGIQRIVNGVDVADDTGGHE